MNEPKDDLLAAFENPDMAEPVSSDYVENNQAMDTAVPNETVAPMPDTLETMNTVPNDATVPMPDVAPVMPSEVTQTIETVMPNADFATNVNDTMALETMDAVPSDTAVPMPEEANVSTTIDSADIIAPEFQNAPEAIPVENNEVATEIEQPDLVANEVTPTDNVDTILDNQNAMPNVEEEPVVSVAQDIKSDDANDEPNSIKKNLKFIAIICIIIALFIIFLPKIMSLFSGSY